MRTIPLIAAIFLVACPSSEPPQDSPDVLVDLGSSDLPDNDTQDSSVVDVTIDSDAAPSCAPSPAMTREGHTSDGWRWSKLGRVFETDPVPANADDGDFSPTILRDGDQLRIYFARKRNGVFTVWTATSSDGVSWNAPQQVTGLEGDNYPSALSTPTGVRLWFGSGSFDVATSVDGVNFTDQQRGVLRPTDVGGFGGLSLIYPTVRFVDQRFHMWFTGFDGATLRIGTAVSDDGVTWSAMPDPVIESQGGTSFDSTSVGQTDVHEIGDALWMWYGGYDTSQTDPGPWRIGLARSTDGLLGQSWERLGVSVPLSEVGDDMWSTRDPAVIQTEDGFLMVYVGMRDDAHYRLLLASSDACP